MPKLLFKFCCCFKPRRCKSKLIFLRSIVLEVDSENERHSTNGNSVPTASPTSPNSIITQVNKDNVPSQGQIIRRNINNVDSNNFNNNPVIRSSNNDVDSVYASNKAAAKLQEVSLYHFKLIYNFDLNLSVIFYSFLDESVATSSTSHGS